MQHNTLEFASIDMQYEVGSWKVRSWKYGTFDNWRGCRLFPIKILYPPKIIFLSFLHYLRAIYMLSLLNLFRT